MRINFENAPPQQAIEAIATPITPDTFILRQIEWMVHRNELRTKYGWDHL
jgi:glucokinase